MEYLRRLISVPVLPAFICLTFPETTYSNYLDTGGFILPWIAAALVAASVAIGVYWRKLRTFISNRLRKDKSIEHDNDSIQE